MAMDFPTLTLKGDIVATTYYDPDKDPNTVLEIKKPWWVYAQWYIEGGIAPALGGDWHLKVNVESMGGGFEGTVANVDIPLDTVPPAIHRDYSTWMNIPVGAIPDEGVYRLVVVLTHTVEGGGVTLHDRIAGFIEGPMLQFYHFEVD